jgi:hypothetical protein
MLHVRTFQQTELRAALRKRVHLGVEAAADLDRSCDPEQLLASLALKFPPPSKRLLSKSNPGWTTIGKPKGPSGAVARASCVADLELLKNSNVASLNREGMCSRQTNDSSANDDDLGLRGRFHLGTSLYGRTRVA